MTRQQRHARHQTPPLRDLRSPGGAQPALLGLGTHRPTTLVSNEALVARGVDTSDSWIRTRSGIAARGLATGEETVVSMSVSAAAKALAAAGLDASDVDLVVLATCSLPQALPGGAPQIAAQMGASAAGAYDVNGACAGFCYALAAAADAVRAGSARHALVIGAERMSDLLDWADRSTCVLFGDGAGAAVVGPAVDGTSGIGPVVWGSDGAAADLITSPGGVLHMQGPAVYRWATEAIAPLARQVCERAGVRVEDLDAVVLHQANLRIIDAVVRALAPAEGTVVARDIVDTGNTSAASVPLALNRLTESGELASGGSALLLAFGAGLTWAGQVVRVP